MESLHFYSNDKYKRYINVCLCDAAIVFWVVPLSKQEDQLNRERSLTDVFSFVKPANAKKELC